MIEVIRALSNFSERKYKVKISLLDLEEWGLDGAYYIVKTPFFEDVKAVINADAGGGNIKKN